jgi:hypothetical protein
MPPPPESQACHVCDAPIEGEPAARGYFAFLHGDHWVTEEPPLCERCALAIGVRALGAVAEDEDEG